MWQIATMFGLTALGAASTLFVLWRKAGVERARDLLEQRLEASRAWAKSLEDTIKAKTEEHAEDLARRDTVIAQLRKEKEALHEVLSKLPDGALLDGLRAEIGIKIPELADPWPDD